MKTPETPTPGLRAWIGVLVLSITAHGAETPASIPRLMAPAHGLEEVPARNVRLDGGFWGPRLRIHHETTVRHVLDKLEKHHHISNFDIAAEFLTTGGSGSGVKPSGASDAALQGDTGESPAAVPEKIRGIVGHSAFDSDVHKALDAANRFADHIGSVFGPGKRYDVDGHQEVELALIKLFRATGEKRHFDLARFLLDERGHLHGTERKPFTDVLPRGNPPRKPGQSNQDYMREKWSMRNGRMQDHKPVLQQTEAVGHAVRAGYMYAAMADIARFSDAPEFTDVLRKLWNDVVTCKIYITGGVGTAQYGDEGFGDPYLLPNKTYCESCSSIANILWQHRMLLLEADARYADVMELVLHNSALSGMALTGDSFFYQNPLESRKGAARQPWIGLACCPTK
jgi:hypothetical protein